MKSPIVAINGGLGNQLFQWYFGHLISGSGGFRIDPLYPEIDPTGQLSFQLENLVQCCAHLRKSTTGTFPKIRFVRYFHFLNRLYRYSALDELLAILGYYRESPKITDRQSKYIPNPIRYAYGYFQRQQLIEQVLPAVMSELQPLINHILPKILERFDIRQPYSVVHVRRYPIPKKFRQVDIGNLSTDYYREGIQNFPIGNTILLVKNASQAQNLIPFLNPQLVLDDEQTTAWETLAIMAGSNFFLGSNSSLSWWGARLARASGGNVWLPSQWSYWNNINPEDLFFAGCKQVEAKWDTQEFADDSAEIFKTD